MKSERISPFWVGGYPPFSAVHYAETLCAKLQLITTFLNKTRQIKRRHAIWIVLDNAVGSISGKVDTINKHIDNFLKEAPTKLQVSVKVSDVDRKTIQDMFDKGHKWMTGQIQKHIHEVQSCTVCNMFLG